MALMVLLGVLSMMAGDVYGASGTTSTWISGIEGGFILNLSYPLCPSSTGTTTLSAGVVGTSFGSTIVDANVFATIRKPDATTTDVNFTNNLSGTYTLAFNFDQNGEYLVQAKAFKTGLPTGDKNAYVYLGDLNWSVAFLNDGFDINVGGLGTIRNTVTNGDGNLVYDVNANTTIYYPDASIADANASMNQLSNGEFVKTIFGPTPAGEYAISSIFKCGNRFEHGTGSFTTVSTSTSSGSTTTTTTTTSSGGGGGGGGASASGKKAQLLDVSFDPFLSMNAPSQMKVTFQNLSNAITDYVLAFSITHPSGEITQGKKIIQAAAPYNPTTIIAEPSFVPFTMGEYAVHLTLKSKNEMISHDTLEETFSVTGQHLLVMDVQPASTKTALGLTLPFTLNLLNTGDFDEENVEISWYLLDPEGNSYTQSNFSTTLNQGESKSFAYSPFIALDSVIGLHKLIVEVIAYNVKQTKTILFEVKSPSDYYAQLISDLEVRVNQIQEKISELKSRGFDVSAVSLLLLDIQQDLARAKGMLLSGNYENLNVKLLDLSARVTRLAAMVDGLEQQAPLLSREGLTLILYIGGGLLLAVFLWLLVGYIERDKKKKRKNKRFGKGMVLPAPLWVRSLIGVNTTYYTPKERKRLPKHKPLISGLLGLEGEK
jgi:hypothetical protein